jgi:hypothetical protein
MLKRVCLLFFLLVAAVGLDAQEGTMRADEYFDRVMANPNLKVEGKATGEQFCWHAASGAHGFVNGYRAWGDTSWLDKGGEYFDWLASLMETAPDGYKGWIGPFIYNGIAWCDVHVGDAILVNPMLDFAELVLKDESLEGVYGEQARRYVQIAERDLLEKWDSRGTWIDDGKLGAYVAWNRYLEPGDLSAWRDMEIDKSGLSLPFNKQMDMGVAALKLFRITGKEEYRVRAEKVFLLMKSRFQYYDQRYVWNYWEPLGPWDIDREEGKIRHWVNVHPKRNYQAREVGFMVEAYHTGVVFDQKDIERILKTNLGVMWNGDREKPRWRNANVGGEWHQDEYNSAGTLWSGLLDFDQTLRDLYALRLKPGTTGHAYFQKVTLSREPGFERKYRSVDEIPQIDFSECRELNMVAVLPQVVARGEKATVICKARVPGELEVVLYSVEGARLETLYAGEIEGGYDGLEGIFWLEWEGKRGNGEALDSGEYRIRWTFGGEYREYPVVIE